MSKINRRGRRIVPVVVGTVTVTAGVTVAAAALTGGGLTGGVLGARALADTGTGGSPVSYGFRTLDNGADPTFNQLLGINNVGTIAGYYGSGAAGHPNKGYRLLPPHGHGSYQSENFPGSVQTQVTGLNNKGVTVGFWSSANNASMVNDNSGFWALGGQFHNANFPTETAASPPVDQLLGVNDSGVAVGFWADANGNNHGYLVNINTGAFSSVTDPNAPGASLTATAINNNGAVAGFYTNPANGNTDAFLKSGSAFIDLAVPGASSTTAFGVNNHGDVVGTYTAGNGSTAAHGFRWTQGSGFQTVDDPHGIGTTVVNGVNDAGDLVGFYTDSAGNTDGMLAAPKATVQVALTPMPQGTVTVGRDSSGDVDAAISAWGLTPGSSHAVELVTGSGGVVASFGTLTADSAGRARATLDSSYQLTPGGLRVAILNGTAGDPVSAELIAATAGYKGGTSTYQFLPVEVDPHGMRFGTPQGSAVLSYDPNAQTISVTVNASGFTPGAHATHIHLGSCHSQGAVQYMVTDFAANANGQILNETRTVTNVTTPLPANGWYLNLHQGNSGNILSNGRPTINFRPLLCGDIANKG
jgi:CHRD domain